MRSVICDRSATCSAASSAAKRRMRSTSVRSAASRKDLPRSSSSNSTMRTAPATRSQLVQFEAPRTNSRRLHAGGHSARVVERAAVGPSPTVPLTQPNTLTLAGTTPAQSGASARVVMDTSDRPPSNAQPRRGRAGRRQGSHRHRHWTIRPFGWCAKPRDRGHQQNIRHEHSDGDPSLEDGRARHRAIHDPESEISRKAN
jgi:hypothetical protein